MTRAIRIALLILALVAPGAAQRPSSPAGPYQVSGIVVHALTLEPVAGVTVMLSENLGQAPSGPLNRNNDEPRPPEIRPVLTGPNGGFAFSGLKAGKYSLSAARRGFSQQSYDQHDQFSTAIVVGPDKAPGQIIFRLQPDATISGRIVDEHNDPVANAQVMLFRDGIQNGRRGIYRAQQVSSSDEGAYRFAHLRPGKFYVVVSAMPWYAQYGGARRMALRDGGFAPQPQDDSNPQLDLAFPITFYPGVTDSARAEAIDLKPGQRETADFSLMAVPSIHLRVTTAATEPQQFVTATVMQEVFDTAEVSARARNTNYGQGVTEIAGLTPGRYLLQLHTNSRDRMPAPTVVREIDVTANMDISAADTPSGVTVSGTLRFDGTAPSDQVRLVLRRRGIPGPNPLSVNTKGEFAAEQPVPPGTYDLVLPLNGYQITHLGVTGGKLTGQSIQVGSSDVRLSITAAKSSGRVLGEVLKDGKPLAGVMIMLVPEDIDRPLLFRRDQSDSDGSFTLPSVAPGKYTVIAIENGWDLEWAKPEVIKPYLASGEPVQVAVDGRYQISVKAQ